MSPVRPRAEITIVGYSLIISVSVLVACGIFCAVVFAMVIKKQRRTAKAQRILQEERTPFVASPYAPQHGAQDPPIYQYNGPLELHSESSGPPRIQQLDGYAAAAKFDNSQPIELPTFAVTR